ncbi:MAG: tetratricopeptide repeat protein, partial [Candidatus Paceibacterota bacterium]
FCEEPLPYRLGMDISQKTLAESTKNIFLGSGPATFLYEYSLHKDRALGVTDVVYTQGPMGIITIASSVGVIAVLFLLAAWLFFIIKGFLFLLADVDHRTKKASDEDELKSILFPIGFSLFATLFFYRLTIVPLAVSFLILGLWAGMLNNKETEFEINADIKSKDKKPLTATIILALVALIIIFGAFMFKSQYIAEALYQRSFKAYNTLNQNSYKKEDLDYPIKLADMAVDIFPNSDYYVGLSQLYIIKASKAFEESSSAGQTSEAKTANENEARNLASQAESLAKIATAREPQNFKTWANLGLIYENTSFLIDDKTKAAIDAYEMAKKLAPNNYEIYFAEGRIYEKKGDKENAIKNYEQALSLNPGLTELTAEIETLKK